MPGYPLTITPLVLWLACSWAVYALDFPSTPSVEPKDAAKTFHVLDGFEMQLIAAEPLVTDPVAITYDADGRAYVCEMNDYPYTDKAAHKPSQENPTDAHIGKVRLLTDTDGDGTFDKATIFADGLSWPTGAACWKGGIFVTATPDVWYLKDTNDDGVADVRQRVFTGFKKLNVQAVMNNPIWGLHHRIYIAGGSNGGEIQRVPGSESVMPIPKDFKPLPIKRNDFSFDPSTGDVRLESGGARFGNTFDDWGNRFLCNIRNPCQHVVLPYRYLARNPYLVVPSALNDCAEAGDQLPVYRTSPPEPWREFRAKRWVQEGSHLPKSELVGAGVVTSSSGITVYRGDAYPKEYRDFAFVADVAGNLFYRMKLVPDGVTFKAVQVDGNKNFCTSDDLWFRPVNFVNAPDGCLHVCDMYREVIEHPWSIPDDIHTAVDLLRGRDKGRLFRLAPKSFKTRTTPKLSTATTTELVALLDHPNAWHRETAQRLLFERQDKAAVEPLRKLVNEGKTPQGRTTALWSMVSASSTGNGNLSQATFDTLRDTLDSDDGKLVAQAAIIAGEVRSLVSPTQSSVLLLQQGKLFEKQTNLGAGALAAVFSLGEASDSQIAELAPGLLRIGSRDSWLAPVAINVCLRAGVTRLAATAFSPRNEDTRTTALLFPQIVEAAVQSPDSKTTAETIELPMVLEGVERDMSDYPVFPAGFPEFAARSISKGAMKKGHKLADLPLSQACITWWKKRIDTMLEQVARNHESLDENTIALAALAPLDHFAPLLLHALAPSTPSEVQLAALEALGSYREPVVADMIIDSWPKMTPVLRDKATTILLSRTDRIAKLLDAIEAKKITPAQLSVAAKATLGRQKTPALAERIAKLIGDGSSSNRKEVIEKYLVAMGIKERGTPSPGVGGRSPPFLGDVTRGSKVYETACMVCHKFADKGNDVGPHLGTIKAWTAEQLVTNILDPNREVSPNFSLYLVETNDGRTLSGLIASETAGNLTLKRADGGTDTVLRSEIKSLTSPGISLMPEGLEAAITPQQMADLIAYLKAP